MTRREFLEKVFFAGLGCGFIVTLGGIIRFLLPPKRSQDGQETAVAGKLAEFVSINTKKIALGGEPVWVIKKDNDFIAISGICTHAGCVVRWDDGKKIFVCPCHGGVFDISGNVLKNPPTTPLPRYNVEIKDGIVYVRR